MKELFSLSEITTIAEKILAQKPSKIILFNGQMGAGKTTLIKEICKVLGVVDTISSPTFSLVNEYKTNSNQSVYHFLKLQLRMHSSSPLQKFMGM